MLVFSFIVGLVSGASLAIILLSLLIAGKKNDAIYYMCPKCKLMHAVGDEQVKTILEDVVQR
jgi:hypothetical protein